MLYWAYRDINIVLSDSEERALMYELAESPKEVAGYWVDQRTRQSLENKAFTLFKRLLTEDSDEFHRRFYFRSLHGEDAEGFLPVYLDAYGRAHRIATIGRLATRKQSELVDFEDSVQGFLLGDAEAFWITVFEFRRFLPRRLVPKCEIAIRRGTINKLFGSVDRWSLVTDTMLIRFFPTHVEILPEPQDPIGG